MRGLWLFFLLCVFSFARDLVFIAYAPVPADLSGLYRYIDRNINTLKTSWDAEVVEVRSYAELIDEMLKREKGLGNYSSVSLFIVGHSDGVSLLRDVNVDGLYLPYTVDLLVLDLCYAGMEGNLPGLSRHARKVIASPWEIPHWGLAPIYQNPLAPALEVRDLLLEIGEFYGKIYGKFGKALKRANLVELRFVGVESGQLFTLRVSQGRISLSGEYLFPAEEAEPPSKPPNGALRMVLSAYPYY